MFKFYYVFKNFKDPKKFTRSFITTEKGFNSQIRRVTFKSGTQHSENFFEVNKVPSKITERFPLHAGNCVLHLSKLILGRFVTFLYDHLLPGSFCLIYCGKKFTFESRMLWNEFWLFFCFLGTKLGSRAPWWGLVSRAGVSGLGSHAGVSGLGSHAGSRAWGLGFWAEPQVALSPTVKYS